MAWGFRTCADNNVQINQISQTDLETEECDHIGAVPSRGTAIAVLFSPRAVPAAYGVNCIFGICRHRTAPHHGMPKVYPSLSCTSGLRLCTTTIYHSHQFTTSSSLTLPFNSLPLSLSRSLIGETMERGILPKRVQQLLIQGGFLYDPSGN